MVWAYVAPALGRMQCRLADVFNTLLRTDTNVMSCARDARVVLKGVGSDLRMRLFLQRYALEERRFLGLEPQFAGRNPTS